MKMIFFILMQIKLIFTLSLILKVRVFGTPQWPVVVLPRNELLIL